MSVGEEDIFFHILHGNPQIWQAVITMGKEKMTLSQVSMSITILKYANTNGSYLLILAPLISGMLNLISPFSLQYFDI